MIEYILYVQICTLAHGCEWKNSGLRYKQEQHCVIKGLTISLDSEYIDFETFRCVRIMPERVPLPRPRPERK